VPGSTGLAGDQHLRTIVIRLLFDYLRADRAMDRLHPPDQLENACGRLASWCRWGNLKRAGRLRELCGLPRWRKGLDRDPTGCPISSRDGRLGGAISTRARWSSPNHWNRAGTGGECRAFLRRSKTPSRERIRWASIEVGIGPPRPLGGLVRDCPFETRR
jgi:hypothetical protein